MRHIDGAGSRHWNVISRAIGILAAVAVLSGDARGAHRMLAEGDATRLGLTRSWFTQVRLDSARNRIERMVLMGDRLTVLTTAGLVQEIDARSGKTYWTAPIGNENYPSLGPAGNDNVVAVVNGSTLFVLDRKDGKPLIIRPVGGAPGATPAVAEKYVFVPLVTGRIEGYPLGDQKIAPWFYQSFGKAMVPPLATPESVVWTTANGHLYVGNSNDLVMRYRLETGSDIVAPPSYHRPFVYVGTVAGNLYAMNELTGARQWRYATGFPITRAPAAIGDRVYIASEQPALHCIDAIKGDRLWEAPNVVQFAAASKNRIYCVDDLGAFVVLNATSGATLARISSGSPVKTMVNDQTDRIYMFSPEGMVVCLHEAGAIEPLYHNPRPVEKEKAAPAEKAPPSAAAKSAEPTEKPAARPKATTPAETPKKDEEKKPAKKGDFGVEENPFG
jgi:outer membrane protein assembly factor BamB